MSPPHVVFGTLEMVEQVLAGCGWQINMSFLERLNLTIPFPYFP
jgi:hypothetical protein